MLHLSCHEQGMYVILRHMKTLIATLRLSEKLQGRTRERCPDVLFTHGGEMIATLRTDVEQPHIPLPDCSVGLIEIRDDALSRVIDEAAWLAELARIVASDGELLFTLPSSGMLAWLDTMNIYRYAVDLAKRGDQPDAALPTGWNRHYSPEDVRLLLDDAGFADVRIQRCCYAGDETVLFATMMWRNWILGDREAEREHVPKYGRRIPGKRRFPIGTTWSISARKRA